jgi:hypothetical protein
VRSGEGRTQTPMHVYTSRLTQTVAYPPTPGFAPKRLVDRPFLGPHVPFFPPSQIVVSEVNTGSDGKLPHSVGITQHRR